MPKQLSTWGIFFFAVIALSYLTTRFLYSRTRVNGSSMKPNLKDGDQLIINKLSYRFQSPKRFDVIVFPFNSNKKQLYIKRIIALPHETIQIKNQSIYINGKLLHESYGLESIRNAARASNVIALEDNEYFVLGDNRNDSFDSRSSRVGNIRRKDIIGKACLRIWPITKAGRCP